MAGPWVTDAQLIQEVADVLKQDAAALPDYYPRQVRSAVDDAYADIRVALLGRGFTDAQLDAWDQRRVYNRDIALFWLLTRVGGFGSYSDVQIVKFDRRKELKDITLTANGVVIPPGTGTGAGGTDVTGDGVPDSFGGAAVGGGRLDSTYWRFDRNKVF